MADKIETRTDIQHVPFRDADPILEAGLAPAGYRLPASTHLGHVSLQVADLSRSLTYYEPDSKSVAGSEPYFNKRGYSGT